MGSQIFLSSCDVKEILQLDKHYPSLTPIFLATGTVNSWTDLSINIVTAIVRYQPAGNTISSLCNVYDDVNE
jgi:hypothetical protein